MSAAEADKVLHDGSDEEDEEGVPELAASATDPGTGASFHHLIDSRFSCNGCLGHDHCCLLAPVDV